MRIFIKIIFFVSIIIVLLVLQCSKPLMTVEKRKVSIITNPPGAKVYHKSILSYLAPDLINRHLGNTNNFLGVTPLENLSVLVITDHNAEEIAEEEGILVPNGIFDDLEDERNKVYINVVKEGYESRIDTIYTKEDTLVESYITLKPK